MRLLFALFITIKTSYTFTAPLVDNGRLLTLKAKSGEESLRPHPPENPPPSNLLDLPVGSPYFAAESPTPELSITVDTLFEDAVKAKSGTSEITTRPSRRNVDAADQKNTSPQAEGSNSPESEVQEENTDESNSALSIAVERIGGTLMDEIIVSIDFDGLLCFSQF